MFEMNITKNLLSVLLLLLIGNSTFAQKGEVLWREDFNEINPNIWQFETGNGNWGWGNGELEFYKQENTSIQEIPNETNNNALVIEAKKENEGDFEYTSSRLKSINGLAVRYGLIEVRMKVPDLGNGLWPAFWMMGTDQEQWPLRGEIDIMEMGHKLEDRERHGEESADINSFVGSNIILYSKDACSEGNPTCAGSAAYDVNYANPYVATTSMADRFVIYRMYWSAEEIRITIEDNGTEYDLFAGPFGLQEGTDTEVFQKPFFFLMNMAVGGTFTDALSTSTIDITTPAKMWVDYISVSKWNDQGEIFTGEIPKPQVSLTSPISNTIENASSVTLEATATSSLGNITKVEFFMGDSLLGQDLSAPYTVEWNNLIAGDYTITVKATDNKGVTQTTAPTIFNVSDLSGEGEVIWEDNFTSIDRNTWKFETGNGTWGWGNGELEFYTENNTSIKEIPEEPGNTAIVITAKEEQAGGFNYTSSRLVSENGVAVKYGVVEVRMKVPDLGNALWPAFWMMGTDAQSWPLRGEIDIMEMGHKLEERERQGHADAAINSYVGSNIILYSEAACSEGNPTCAGSTAYDVDYSKPYVSSTTLANKFVKYKMYWSPSSLRITIVDDNIEYDLFESPFGLESGTDTEAFQKPFFFLMNMAVGGNFTDAATMNDVNFDAPAEMWIDYIKVSKWNGRGEVFKGRMGGKTGKFAVFTNDDEINNGLTVGVDANVYVWENSLKEGTSEPFEGANALAWESTTNAWFGGGIAALEPQDMSDYQNGSLKFYAKIPEGLGFKVGIIAKTNESWITFPANQNNYGLTRNGEWAEIVIPIDDFGWLDLTQVEYLFAIAAEDGSKGNYDFAFDNIYWDDTPVKSLAPKVSILTPSNNQILSDISSLSLSSSAYDLDGEVVSVTYFVNDSIIGVANSSPFTISWNDTPTGEHIVIAKAEDNSGVSSISAPITFVVTDSNEGIGEVIWEDNFDTIDKTTWQFETGNGNWGWGNGELEYYTEKNSTIKEVPNEESNKAIVITAQNDNIRGFGFSSSRLKTQDKLAIKYGVVEARIQVPNLEGGLWPAFWMLGTGSQGWPSIGELDIMEMGHNPAYRLKHLEDSTITPDVNNYTAANIIWKSAAACSDDNPTCAANGTWFKGSATPYVSETSMANRFVTYRMYWSPKEIRYTIIDNGQEYDLLPAPFNIESGDGLEAFHKPFYFLMNLAVGGLFPDILNKEGVTADMPSEMWIDYVKVSKWNGVGEVIRNTVSNKKEGLFGVFTDNTSIDSKLEIGVDTDVFVWENTLKGGTTPPYQGTNVIAWETNQPNWWFGAGITCRDFINLSDKRKGSLKFKIKIPADVGFKIGVETTDTQYWIDFKANEDTYGLTRNGEWGEAIIPISNFNGINLEKVTSPFLILSGEGGTATTFEMAVDDIVWDPSSFPSEAPTVQITSPTNGIELENPSTLSIAANAEDIDGTIQRVEFYYGPKLIGIATEAPYVIQWNNIKEGDHVISAKAIDNTDLSSTSTIQVSVVGEGIGEVIWREDFNTIDPSVWGFEIGNGNWGWGNGELEYYREENASIEQVPNEVGNSALVIEAKKEDFGGKSYTSSRMLSKDKIAVKYGVVEIRMRTPNIEGGLWPAAWLLGTGAGTWPSIGEIDMMEMGQNFDDRARQNFPYADANNYVASNIIWYSDQALSPQNPTGAASAAWDPNYANPYVADSTLQDRFVTYRMYWSSSSIKLSIVDDSVEHFMFEQPHYFSEETSTFQKPFYFLLNMAVGGVFTDAHAEDQLWATLPAKMYVDYIQVSKWNGEGEIVTGASSNIAAKGRFGVFTDETAVNNKVTPGLDADIYLWNNLAPTSITPFEGSNTISWTNQVGSTWYGGGVHSRETWDLSNYKDGYIKFNMKLPTDVGIRVGFTSTSAEYWVPIQPNENVYGLERTGDWEEVIIPVSAFNVEDLSQINAPFLISSLDPLKDSIYSFAFDNMYWESATITSPIVDIIISQPENTIAYLKGDNLQISSNAYSPNSIIEKVEYYLNDEKIGEVAEAPYTFILENIGYGDYSISAKVVDANGVGISTKKEISIVEKGIYFALPSIAFTSIENNQLFSEGETIVLQVDASSENGMVEKVEFYDGQTLIGTSTVAPFTFLWENPALGSHVVTAKVVDAITSATSSAIVINVEENNCVPSNIAIGKDVTQSSTEGYLNADFAIDGDSTTRSSTNFSIPQWIKIDLKRDYDIEAVKLVWERANADAYYILMSDEDTDPDPSTWTIISDQSGLEDKARTDSLINLSGSGRYIAMYATSKQHPYGISLFEFEIFPTCESGKNNAPTPVINFTQSGSSYQFDASLSNDSDGDLLAYQWNFGDGTTSTLENPLHNYYQNGEYAVSLTVYDGKTEESTSILVNVNAVNTTACTFYSNNGDFSVEVEKQDNPTVTFIPTSILGSSEWVIITTFVDGNITGGFYMEKEGENFTFTLPSNLGENVAFYFTYQHNGVGQKDTNNDKVELTIGECGNNARINLEQNSLESEVVLYPNPSKGTFDMKMKELTSNQNIYIRVINISGTEVYAKETQTNALGELNERFELSKALNTGMYQLIIIGDDFSESVSILIK
ncbi:glycosyl hydrolase family protein [Flammeovirga pectinis]|uniref:Glycosyl hydrolase family protein n=2 Tax=Flammeovirga pectinis TaxID=2494373 RepID=A0A3S9NYR5_9BACT|nr:glycosyl hydrolase family protein [Flammeovirga pectinis]